MSGLAGGRFDVGFVGVCLARGRTERALCVTGMKGGGLVEGFRRVGDGLGLVRGVGVVFVRGQLGVVCGWVVWVEVRMGVRVGHVEQGGRESRRKGRRKGGREGGRVEGDDEGGSES